MESWIIQDGNYDDFKLGQMATFALQCHMEQISVPSKVLKKRALPVTTELGIEGAYCIEAEVICNHPSSGMWFIDFGVRAYLMAPENKGLETVDAVSGVAILTVDPYMYKELRGAEPAIPNLTYDWEIEKIEKVIVPFIRQPSSDPLRPYELVPDTSELRLEPVQNTTAFEDNISDSYILHCKLVDLSHKREG